jgi:predicted HAD superfamily Cof-like phosphohydrolase
LTRGAATERQTLLEEEVAELAEAVNTSRLDLIAHELADVIYVAYGSAIAYGIDIDAVITEVHAANMTKLNDVGQAIVANGKVVKSENYRAPNIAKILKNQGWTRTTSKK